MGCGSSSSGGSGGSGGGGKAPKKGGDKGKANNPNPGAAGSGVSENYKTFAAAFKPLCQLNEPDSKAKRGEAWKLADPNGNGQCSLAELDGWIKQHLLNADPASGETVWKAFRPCYIRAFTDAKDIGEAKPLGTSTANTDDYIQARTFRVFCSYLCIYGEMYDAFALVDGGGEGVSKDDDRKISPDELKAGIDKLKGFSFAAFTDLDAAKADELFKQMDADGKGAVMLIEWCRFIEQAEQKAGTVTGKLLAIGDDEAQ